MGVACEFGQRTFVDVYIRTTFQCSIDMQEEIMPTLLAPDLEQDKERRASARVSYGAVLGVIEHNGTLPETAELRPVKALDLSHNGVSFTTTRWPSRGCAG